MPRTRLDKYKYKKRDELMEIIRGRIDCGGVPLEDMADVLGVSKRQVYNRLAWPSEKWELGDLIKVCRKIGITQEEFRERVKF